MRKDLWDFHMQKKIYKSHDQIWAAGNENIERCVYSAEVIKHKTVHITTNKIRNSSRDENTQMWRDAYIYIYIYRAVCLLTYAY